MECNISGVPWLLSSFLLIRRGAVTISPDVSPIVWVRFQIFEVQGQILLVCLEFFTCASKRQNWWFPKYIHKLGGPIMCRKDSMTFWNFEKLDPLLWWWDAVWVRANHSHDLWPQLVYVDNTLVRKSKTLLNTGDRYPLQNGMILNCKVEGKTNSLMLSSNKPTFHPAFKWTRSHPKILLVLSSGILVPRPNWNHLSRTKCSALSFVGVADWENVFIAIFMHWSAWYMFLAIFSLLCLQPGPQFGSNWSKEFQGCISFRTKN